jgi:hypothetical protein
MRLSCAPTCSVSAGASTDACVDSKTQAGRRRRVCARSVCLSDRYDLGDNNNLFLSLSGLTELGHSHINWFHLWI